MLTRSESERASICDGVGGGGLPTDIERVILRNGSTVVIRPLASGDEAAIARWFAAFSAETRHARFFGFLGGLIVGPSLRLRVWATSTMRRSRRSLADGATVGTRATSDRQVRGGELAVAVADDWRGQASLACCSNGSQPGRVPSGSSNSP